MSISHENAAFMPSVAKEINPATSAAPKRIGVTGGAGFLGSHLCVKLVANGHDVVCMDNFHTGRPHNVSGLSVSNRFRLVEQDVTEPFPDDFEPFDEIWNLACPASPVHYQADRYRTAFVCADGAKRVLERAVIDGARIFHASTSEIYGDPDVHPQVESYFGNVNSVGPRSCYDEGKRFAETVFTDFSEANDLTLRMVRIFNTYGPRMQADDGRVVSNFVIQALRGENITIYGDGSQTRSFCYVDDLIDGFLRLMDYDGDYPGPVNMGNPVETPVGELAKLVIELTGSKSRVEYRPRPQDDPRRRRPDITRAKMLLDWSPSVTLSEGVAKTIEYFEGQLTGIVEPTPLFA